MSIKNQDASILGVSFGVELSELLVRYYNQGYSTLPKMTECKVKFGKNVGMSRHSEVFKQIIQ